MNEIKKRQDVLKVQGRMTLGYGIIPKMPMQDKRLTIEAKAIYSYFCSYAGAGTTAFPSRDKILHDLQIGETRYYKHFNLLKQYGYISVEQSTDNKGKFKNNVYTLIEMIEPCTQNKGTVTCTHFAGTDNSYTDNVGTKSNSLKNNSFKNNNSNIFENQQSKSTSDRAPKLSTIKNDKTMTDTETMTTDTEIISGENVFEQKKEPSTTPTHDSKGLDESPSADSQSAIYDYTSYRQIIQDNINYSHFLHNRHVDVELIDELINCMLDVICTKGDTVKINGEGKNRNMVISQYLKINSMDIEHIIERYKGQHHKITHLHAYLKTMLYTIKQEHGHYYTNAVRADHVVW